MSRSDQSDSASLRCPICSKPSAAPAVGDERSPRPFCSERCKLIDLGRWLDGRYQIPVEDEDLDESQVAPIHDDGSDVEPN